MLHVFSDFHNYLRHWIQHQIIHFHLLKKQKTHYSDRLNTDSTKDWHGDPQMTSILLCSGCLLLSSGCLLLSSSCPFLSSSCLFLSSGCLVLSSCSVELCTGCLVNVVPAEARWWFRPASGISPISCNIAKIDICQLQFDNCKNIMHKERDETL